VKVVQGDIKVWPEVLNAVKDNNVEDIFHHGSMLSIPSDLNPWGAFQVNIMGSMHVLEAARLFGVRRFVFASTDATYGLGTGAVIDDETLQRPITMYGAGKLYIELLGRFYRRKFGLDFRAVRYCMVMRPGVKVRALPVFMLWMVENAALGEPFECFAAEDVAVFDVRLEYDLPPDNVHVSRIHGQHALSQQFDNIVLVGTLTQVAARLPRDLAIDGKDGKRNP